MKRTLAWHHVTPESFSVSQNSRNQKPEKVSPVRQPTLGTREKPSGLVSAAEMEAYLFSTLAGRSEQPNENILKLGPPDLFAGVLPIDVTKLIARHVPQSVARSFASTCRQFYLSASETDRSLRARGIVKDIEAVWSNASFSITHSLETLIQHLAKGSTYDSVLLTPLSIEDRLTGALALLVLATPRSRKDNFDKSFDIAIKNFADLFEDLATRKGRGSTMNCITDAIRHLNCGTQNIRINKRILDHFNSQMKLSASEIDRLHFANLTTTATESSYRYHTYTNTQFKSFSNSEIVLLCACGGIYLTKLHEFICELPMASRWNLLDESLSILKDHCGSGGFRHGTKPWVAEQILSVCAVMFTALDNQVPSVHTETVKRACTLLGEHLLISNVRSKFSDLTQRFRHSFEEKLQQGMTADTIRPDVSHAMVDSGAGYLLPPKIGYVLGRLYNWLNLQSSANSTQTVFQKLWENFFCDAVLEKQ